MNEDQMSSADRLTLHLSEIGRLQNNAGATLQFMALLFVICVYYFNALIYPNTPHRIAFAIALIITAALITYSCIQFVRILMASTIEVTSKETRLYSKASELELEETLAIMERRFRTAASVFIAGVLSTFGLVCLLALGQLGILT